MKGLEMNIVNLVILIIALAILSIVIMKLIPTFGNFVSSIMKEIKTSFCKTIGLASWLLGC